MIYCVNCSGTALNAQSEFAKVHTDESYQEGAATYHPYKASPPRYDYWMGALTLSAVNFSETFDMESFENNDDMCEFLRMRFDAIIEEVREFKVELGVQAGYAAIGELMDVIYVSVQTLTQLHQPSVVTQFEKVIAKNNAKNLTTHHKCSDGKVRKNDDERCICCS